MQVNKPQVHIWLEQIYGRYEQDWPDARPYDKHRGSWHHIKLGIYMVQLAMHNLLLIYKAEASGPLLLLNQLFQSRVLEFLLVGYCSSEWRWNGKLKPFTVGDKLLLHPTDKMMFSHGHERKKSSPLWDGLHFTQRSIAANSKRHNIYFSPAGPSVVTQGLGQMRPLRQAVPMTADIPWWHRRRGLTE